MAIPGGSAPMDRSREGGETAGLVDSRTSPAAGRTTEDVRGLCLTYRRLPYAYPIGVFRIETMQPQDARSARRAVATEVWELLTTRAGGGAAERTTLPMARWASIHPRPASQK